MLTKYYIHKDCNDKQYMYIREKDINCPKKKTKLHDENCSCMMSANGVNMSYDKFIEIFSQHFNGEYQNGDALLCIYYINFMYSE